MKMKISMTGFLAWCLLQIVKLTAIYQEILAKYEEE